jgi:agmatine deiminase
MRAVILSAFLLWAGVSAPASARVEGWIFPGEYESHEAMWMLWPTYENKAGFASTEPVADMIGAMHGHTNVNLAVQDAADEAAARTFLAARGVALDHVTVFHLEHLDLWARDMGPQFVRNTSGDLRVTDWDFNYWGYEEPNSFNSRFEESFDRRAAAAIGVPVLKVRPARGSGARLIHEGGSASHNGRGTMIAVESVVMQRNLGPHRFCGGSAPVTDFSQPNTYAPNRDWPACKLLVEQEYRRVLGVKKVIWIPAGVIEDTGTFRGALGKHVSIGSFDGVEIPHAGVYTMFGTNGHPDEFVRFVSAETVVLGEARRLTQPAGSPQAELVQWLEDRNAERLERAFRILSKATTEAGHPIKVVRIPMPVLTLDSVTAGDGLYDYFSTYDRSEDGSTTPPVMFTVWPASYVNYVPTNGLVLVPSFWKPGRALEIKKRDAEAVKVLARLFPGRRIVQVHIENVVRGGGGMNCITQQQPASSRSESAARIRLD